MRAATAILAAAVLLTCLSCNTLRQAGEVAARLGNADPASLAGAGTIQTPEQQAAFEKKAQEIAAKGGNASEADIEELTKLAMGQAAAPAAAKAGKDIPPDQEISVNLVFAGLDKQSKAKNLDFNFKALWGEYRTESKPLSMPASAGKSEARLNLDVAKMRVVPKVVSATHGKYEVELTDPAGSLIGRFDIKDSGKQVEMLKSPTKYRTDLVYFHPERRLTGFAVYKAGTREAEMGLIFVGKGWAEVEKTKKLDLSKGYIFPEVDLVVLPKAWMQDNEMKETCNTLKRGNVSGGVCYS
jgi:hypothetical protein